VVKWLSIPLVFPLLLALYYGERLLPLLLPIVITVIVGLALERLDPDPELGPAETFLMVGSTWLLVAVMGALPYVIAGNGTVAHPVNALFESMSGFTTTGATVLDEISFERHSRSVLMWRQLTQWLGGMGIIVLGVAILSQLAVGGMQVMETEAPGLRVKKLTPHIAETARILWGLYAGITVGYMALLYGLHLLGYAPNMDLYNAIAHGFTTLSTGGFSPEARSIEAFSPVVQWAMIPFMIVAGTNFALLWHAVDGDPGQLLTNVEFKSYIGVIIGFCGMVTVLLFTGVGVVDPGDVSRYPTIAFRWGLFQVVSLLTTTGYASADFNTWTPTAQYVLFLAMFIGGMAGSTSGCIKLLRWLVIVKSIRRELVTAVHPEVVRPVRVAGEVIDEDAIRGVYVFTVIYFVLFFVATLFVIEDTARAGLALGGFESLSATAATLGNIGPGFGIVGPMENYEPFPDSTKLLMVFLMWVGRLEIVPVLALFVPSFWRE
jgi:trk system potassium uptake protein TrkH